MKNVIIYDFDGTLTPYAMPKFEILEKCGMPNGAMNPKFMEMVKKQVSLENIDLYNALYKTFFQIIKNAHLSLTDDNFTLGADSVVYNKGVEDFLRFLTDNNISNYLLSSGLKVFLEQTRVAKFFDSIYATTFIYDNKEAIGIDYLMSDKNKVEAIKDILKNMGNEKNDCRNIIYIGDGLTDYYAMKYVKRNGGITIFVYQDENNQDLKRLEADDVINFSAYADFSSDSELSNYIKSLCLARKER